MLAAGDRASLASILFSGLGALALLLPAAHLPKVFDSLPSSTSKSIIN
jgi:hypothetical protein